MENYLKLKDYWTATAGGRVQKISLHAGMTCPNRDGSIGVGGCLYCSNEAFTPSYCHESFSLKEQLDKGLQFQKKRYPRAAGFVGYLQAYTNTYGKIEELIECYETVLNHPGIMGLVIGTRPDCLTEEIVDWLAESAKDNLIYVELGIESFSDTTLHKMNRGHTFADSCNAIQLLHSRNLRVGGHFLVGFPGEPWQNFFQSSEQLNSLNLHSVKVHQLHVFKDTGLANWYHKSPEDFNFPDMESYFEHAANWIKHIRPDMYIDRLFGDAPFKYVVKQGWGIRMDRIVAQFDKYIAEQNIQQGQDYISLSV